jgi:magnesium-transporting ATPase (P-type)
MIHQLGGTDVTDRRPSGGGRPSEAWGQDKAGICMNIHQRSVSDALAAVDTGEHGLSAREAARRMQTYGLNQVAEVQRRPRLATFLRELTSFFSIVLWLAAGLTFLAEWSAPGQGMARLGVAVVVVIVVSGAFSFWQEYRAERALAALQRLLPTGVAVLRDGTVTYLPAAQLVPGDVVLLEAGDRVPADCRLIEAFAVRVNTATVTGEPVTHDRRPAGGTMMDWHLTQFYPAYRMLDRQLTPVATLWHAWEIGLDVSLRYTYEGNVPGEGGEHTYC